MREKQVPEKNLRIVEDMCKEARTIIRASVCMTEWISVKVGLHQGSSLSPYLIDFIMEVLARGGKQEAPWGHAVCR